MLTYTYLKPPEEPGTIGGITWKRNEVFSDALELVDYQTGTSAITFVMKSILSGSRFYMGISGFFAATRTMENRVISGKFVFVKYGRTYLIEEYHED